MSLPSGFQWRGFMESSLATSWATAANLVRAVVTAKLLAVALGPTSLGIFAQVLNLFSLLVSTVPLIVTTGVTKMVADNSDNAAALEEGVGTAAGIALILGVCVAAFGSIASPTIAAVLTGSGQYSGFVLLVFATLPASNLTVVATYALQGLSEVKLLAVAGSVGAAIAICLTVPLVLKFGMLGAAVALVATSFTQLGFFAIAIQLALKRRATSLTRLRFVYWRARHLATLGTAIIMSAGSALAAVLIVRTLTVRTLGSYENGIYQAVFGVSAQYMAMFLAWMNVYTFPLVARQEHVSQVNVLLNRVLTANLFVMVPLLTFVLVFRDAGLRILYSTAFGSAAVLLPLQVLGDALRVVGWSLGISLFARGRLAAHILPFIVQSLIWVCTTALLLRPMGLLALPLGYAISNLASTALMYLLAVRFYSVTLTMDNLVLVPASLLAITVASVGAMPFRLTSMALVPLWGTLKLASRTRRRRQTTDGT